VGCVSVAGFGDVLLTILSGLTERYVGGVLGLLMIWVLGDWCLGLLVVWGCFVFDFCAGFVLVLVGICLFVGWFFCDWLMDEPESLILAQSERWRHA